MASYDEYANRQPRDPQSGQYVSRDDGIEREINEAAAAQAQRNIPESVANRFAGKSVDEVLESYAALEKKLGQQGEEMGYLRRQQQQLMELQLASARQPHVADTAEPVSPITADELYNNPDEAISRVVESRAKSQLEPIQRELEQLRIERAKATLERSFPDWETEVRSDDFRQWVEGSSFRQRMAQAGDSGDLGAATDLLSDWYSRKESKQEQSRQQHREKQLDDASLIESSPAQMRSEPGFNRAEIQEKRIRATQGDRRAKDWLQMNAEAIRLAYQEGRVT